VEKYAHSEPEKLDYTFCVVLGEWVGSSLQEEGAISLGKNVEEVQLPDEKIDM
jgi:hypothetical protein